MTTISNYDRLRNNFERFDIDNPQIWELLVKFSREAVAAGVTKTSISLLIERIRWEMQVVTRSTDRYKISNSHRAFYARKLMQTYPEFDGLFQTKVQK